MKQHGVSQAIVHILAVNIGTIIVFVVVAAITSLVSGRIFAAHAEVSQTNGKVVQPTTLPTGTIPPRVGDLINHPAIQAQNPGKIQDLSMRFTNSAPIITQQEAQQIAFDTGYTYAMGGIYEGRPVTVTGVYGMLTYGATANTDGLRMGDGVSPVTGSCQGWVGPCNWPVQVCRAGDCKDTGKRIERIQNRPYWLLDFSNIIGERQACPDCPKQVSNHTVVVVDAQDRFVLMGWAYNGR